MNRRNILLVTASAALLRPSAGRAQSAAVPVVGFVNASAPGLSARSYNAFREGLANAGFVEGRTVQIEQRWAEGDYARLPGLIADLIGRGVAVIKVGGPPAVRAAKAATSTIPIVFTSGEDPVAAGFVASLARPGGNMTGISLLSGELAAKRLDLARELAPSAELIALLINRTGEGAMQSRQSQEAARLIGKRLLVLEAGTAADVVAAFAEAANQKAGVMLIGSDPFINSQRAEVAGLERQHALPTISFNRTIPDSGGLMSYGTDFAHAYRQAGGYVARILKGEKPADLPVQQPTKFELVINLKTAKALGLTLPTALLATADEVIE